MDENNKTQNQNKFLKFFSKIKGNLAIILVVVVVFVWFFAEIGRVVNVKLETQTALEDVVYDTIDTKALVVRNESVIANDKGAVTVPYVADGDKVKVGGKVAMEFSSEEKAHTYSDYLDLEKEIQYYEEMEKSSVGQVTDVESIDKDILQDVNGYIRSNAVMDSVNSKVFADELNSKFTRRQILIGENIDFSTVISSVQSEIDALGASSCQPTGYVTTDMSGIFTRYTDGCESMFDYKNIEKIDVETLQNYIKNVENAKPTNSIGKIVRDFDWYFCTVVKTSDITTLKNGNKVEVTLKNSDEVLNCKIISGADAPLGKEETVLVLKCSEMNSEMASLRLEDIKIRVDSHKGIKMPIEAVHIKNGEKGVYALVSSVVEWRKADVLYTGEDYVILSYDSKDKDGIKLYDEIIIRGRDLHDGKVYT